MKLIRVKCKDEDKILSNKIKDLAEELSKKFPIEKDEEKFNKIRVGKITDNTLELRYTFDNQKGLGRRANKFIEEYCLKNNMKIA